MPETLNLEPKIDLAKEYNLHPLIFQLLEKRGLADSDTLEKFLRPTSSHFRDPLLMKGMGEVVQMIRRARQENQTLFLHGDYDADGISATALISKVLDKLSIRHHTFLPERAKHGYGLSHAGVSEAKKSGAHIIMTLDCGISSLEEVQKARELGLDVLIVDHHQMKPELPNATAILHPLLKGNEYPFKAFSAAGLAYKIAQALLGQGALEFLELGALGTVSDLVPLLDENRTLVRGGLKQLTENPSLGIQALKEVGSLRASKMRATHIGYILGPRINAPGRLGSPQEALKLLLTNSLEEARHSASVLDQCNRERQRLERGMVKDAIQKAEVEFNWARDRIFFLWDEDWHSGVAGIVASRIVEKFKKPALVAALDKGMVKGSGRSVKGFNLFELLSRHQDSFESFGGHEQAVGFTLTAGKVEALRGKLQKSALEMLEGENFG